MSAEPDAKRVAVIGAGWAGMAAAVSLAARGVRVKVFESSRHLGGRARRVEVGGMPLDNGQHILIGAYRETLALMREVGADPDRLLLRLPLELRYADGFRLKAAALPYPLNLLGALCGSRAVPVAEVVQACAFVRRLSAAGYLVVPDRPVAQWLDEQGQRGALRARLWEPLCVAALNTPVERASSQVFARVLRDGLGGSRDASDLLLARADLGELLPEPAARYVRSHAGAIVLGSPVRALARDGPGLFLDNDPDPFASVVVACGPQHAAPLLGCFPELAPTTALIQALEYEPIVTCYLQYAEDVRLPAPMLGLTGGLAQWVFDRGQLDAQPGLLAAVISAGGAHEALSNAELAARLDAELRAALGVPALRWSRVIAEKRATFSCRAALARPGTRTALAGLVLAGDYVAGRYPGTLEAAVRSGRAAARALLSDEPSA